MLIRGMVAAAALMVCGQGALAGEAPGAIRRMSCSLVRFYVAKYSEAAAEGWARSHGASETEIEIARKCLGGSTMQTANFAPK
jgi:hypothetical protein